MEYENLTQDKVVLLHLKKYGSITSWDAIKKYHITRLSARIHNLRRRGFVIQNQWFYSRRLFGLLKDTSVRYVKYVYKEAKPTRSNRKTWEW